jgi:hypothetical protein
MSKVLTVFLIVACASAGIFGQAKRNKFDPDGSFWIHGEPPKDFSDLSAINLNAKKLRRLPSPGVELKTGKTLRFQVLNVTRESFTFRTVVLSNFSYSFTGKFLKGGVYAAANLDEETPVLEGTLTKYKNGEKIAEAQLKFVYFGGT